MNIHPEFFKAIVHYQAMVMQRKEPKILSGGIFINATVNPI